MKRWKQKIKIKDVEYEVREHTDKECGKKRSDGKHLAPLSHGFVCLYKDGIYEQWCGVAFAERHKI